jgi:fatty-acyl-CoA synthase
VREASGTLPDALRDAAVAGGGGLVFHLRGGVDRWPPDRLQEAATAAAGVLAARGVLPGQAVGLLGPNRPEWARWAFAVWSAGAALVPLPHPVRVRDRGALAEQIASLVAAAGCLAVVAAPELADLVPPHLVIPWDRDDPGWAPAVADVAPDDVAVIQFTSGSTAAPRGVVLTHGAVLAAVRSIGEAYRIRPKEDVYLGWLPFFHDNGLFAYVVRPVVHGCEGHLFATEDFARDPATWFRLAERAGATITSGPCSAWGAALRAADRRREGGALSTLRLAILAAEPIDPAVVDQLEAAGGWLGLRPSAIGAAYGLAEATLGVTATEPGEGLTFDRVGLAGLAAGRAEPAADGPIKRVPSCGRPMPGVELRIDGPDGAALDQRGVGEVLVRAPSLLTGYVGGAASPVAGGWLHTGDRGYLAGDELYLTGRIKDLIIMLGRNYTPEDLEWAAGRVAGVRPGRSVAFSRPGGHEEAVVVVEPRDEPEEGLAERVGRAVADAVGLRPSEVLVVPRGTVPKTTSGKLRRGALRDAYVRGELIGAGTPGAGDAPRDEPGLASS